jgi:reactive chlorine resistance protein C
MMENKISKTGFYLALYGTVIVLVWIGIFKFTPTEAKAIKPLVENSPLMSWLYLIGNEQQVSNFIGIFEIITAALLATFPFSKKLSLVGGVLNTVIFLSTLSFMFTTPNSFNVIDGILLPDAFILKDLAFLGVGLMVIGTNYPFFKQNIQ